MRVLLFLATLCLSLSLVQFDVELLSIKQNAFGSVPLAMAPSINNDIMILKRYSQ
jgi:hypothetical protein